MFSEKIKTLRRLEHELKSLACEVITKVDNREGMSAEEVQAYTPIICEVCDEFSDMIELIKNLHEIEDIMNGG